MKKTDDDYKYDDAYVYADKSSDCEIGLVIALVTIAIIACIVKHTLF